jgi:hypothetical protein
MGKLFEEDVAPQRTPLDYTGQFNPLEQPLEKYQYTQLAHEVDLETAIMSGNLNGTETYRKLARLGPQVMPFIVEDLRQQVSWWKMEMIWEFSAEVLSQCVVFPREIRGRVEPVRQTIVTWWDAAGEAAYKELSKSQ